MTERISTSIAVSVLSHLAVIVVAVVLLSSVSKIEILPVPTTSFVLVETDTRRDLQPPSASESKPFISLPPSPRPVVEPAITAHTPENVLPVQAPIEKPSVARPTTLKPALSSQPRMSFDDYQALHVKKPVAERTTITRITAPSFPNPSPASQLNNAATSQATLGDSTQLRSFNAELIERLREAYLPVGAEDRALSCRIEFVLAAAGHIASSKILKSSGNPAFDNAVLEALGRVRVSTPPKMFMGVPLTTTFQVAQ